MPKHDNGVMNWLDQVKWDAQGLVPVIAQEAATGDVLMFAWMNREALDETLRTGRVCYWSRSRRQRLVEQAINQPTVPPGTPHHGKHDGFEQGAITVVIES